METGSISAILLAGGRGRRMDGRDKGLVELCGKPLVEWVVDAIAPQVDDIVISANRNLDQYRQLGCRVIGDELADFQGPLAGVLACGRQVTTEFLAVVAVDAPVLPADFIVRLRLALEQGGSALAVVEADGMIQPTHMVFHGSLLDDLDRWLAAGHRKMQDWIARQDHVRVRFDDGSMFFVNVNDEQQLAALSERLCK